MINDDFSHHVVVAYCINKSDKIEYRMRAMADRAFNYFFVLSHVSFSLIFSGIPLYFFEPVRLLNKSGYN